MDGPATREIADHLKRLHTWHSFLGVIGIYFSLLGVYVAWHERILHEKQALIENLQEQVSNLRRSRRLEIA